MAGSDSTQKTTTTSGPSNPALNDTLTKLSQGISAEYAPGKSLYQAPGATTQAGWGGALQAAGNPDFASGISGALGSYGNRAAGNEIGMEAPGYAALRSKLSDDVLTQTNTAFNSSGLFGSDQNQRAAAGGLAEALGGLDYGQYQDSLSRQAEAAGMLPGLFGAGQMPSSVQQQVGGAQDAAAQAEANGPTDLLAKLTALLGGAAGASPQTSTTSAPGTPLWQTLAGLAVSAL